MLGGMTLPNSWLADALEDIAKLLEVEDGSPFRIRAYRNGADAVRASRRELSEVLAAGEDLTSIPDIGKAIAEKVAEMLGTGEPSYPEGIVPEVARGLLAMMSVPGVGPKRVRVLRDELSITNLHELEAAASEGKLSSLPGLGAKTEEQILRRVRRKLEADGAPPADA